MSSSGIPEGAKLPEGVKSTKAYDMFKKVVGNRQVQEGNVRALMRSMEKYGNLMATNPVIVNENMEVIDGQHRIEAAKRLGYDVAYTVREGESIGGVVGLNAAATPWKKYDYAVSWAERGIEDYQKLLRLVDKYQVPFGVVAFLAGAGYHGGHTKQSDDKSGRRLAFQAGEFQFKNYEQVETILEQYRELKEYVQPIGSSYDLALFSIMSNASYDHDRMKEKYQRYGHFIKPQRTKQDYINEIEDIYNYNARDRVRFFI